MMALVCCSIAFLLTLVFVPIVVRFCNARRLLDQPGPLKIHRRPLPRLGGVAIIGAIVITAFVGSGPPSVRAWPFFAGLAVVWIASLVDDIRSLSAAVRLAAQLAAGISIWLAGWRVPLFSWPDGKILSLLATCILVAGFVNALNFLDGSDGLAAGVSAIIAAAYALVFLSAGDARCAVLASAAAGACLGFLAYNLPPAKIFMGDSGSAALGFLIAFFALESWRARPLTPPKLLFPFLIAALPLLDAAFAILRRVLSGSSPLYGDRFHLYDLQLRRKWSPRNVALFFYVVTIFFAAVALWGAWRERAHFPIIACAGLALLAGYMLRLGSLRTEVETPPEGLVRPLKGEETGSA